MISSDSFLCVAVLSDFGLFVDMDVNSLSMSVISACKLFDFEYFNLLTKGKAKELSQMEKITRDVTKAHELQESIIQSVFDYVDDDFSRSTFGINAALQAGVQLVKNFSMSDQTRMSIAQTIFQDLTEDIHYTHPNKI